MPISDYADSAQARETDRAYQREQPSIQSGGSSAFWAACEARNKAERVASKPRIKAAVDQFGVFFGYTK